MTGTGTPLRSRSRACGWGRGTGTVISCLRARWRSRSGLRSAPSTRWRWNTSTRRLGDDVRALQTEDGTGLSLVCLHGRGRPPGLRPQRQAAGAARGDELAVRPQPRARGMEPRPRRALREPPPAAVVAHRGGRRLARRGPRTAGRRPIPTASPGAITRTTRCATACATTTACGRGATSGSGAPTCSPARSTATGTESAGIVAGVNGLHPLYCTHGGPRPVRAEVNAAGNQVKLTFNEVLDDPGSVDPGPGSRCGSTTAGAWPCSPSSCRGIRRATR